MLPREFYMAVGLGSATKGVLYLAHRPEEHWVSARPDGRLLASLASASATAVAALPPSAVATSAFPSTPAFVAPASVAPTVFTSPSRASQTLKLPGGELVYKSSVVAAFDKKESGKILQEAAH